MCIQTGKTLDDENRMRMDTDQLYVKSEDEMLALFPGHADAVQRAHDIAMRCNVTFDFNTVHLPHFPVPDGETSDTLLRKLVEEGFAKRYAADDPVARERLEYEIGVITQMGYVDYFLIVWDFVKFAKDAGIMVGPGRGSGAASIVAKVERDRYMVELDAQYPQYGFARNKGYGTAEHIAALKQYGPCPEHRRSFIQKILGGQP